MKRSLFITFAVLILLSLNVAAEDCAVVGPDAEMTIREMQKKIEAQEKQIELLECQQLMQGNVQLCFDNFPLCFKRYMKCHAAILEDKKKKYPEMYEHDGWRRRRRR